ncbi:MAG: DUF362 domain-containing protein [Planctomycetaceae bacterium]|jgi:uncharacterized protein (DUF362 family)|nr:DUF362 domain-containing protein [Planctomycetaceae bacterium]
MEMNRKEFLQVLGVAGTTVAVNGLNTVAFAAQDSNKDNKVNLVTVQNGEPDAMFRSAIEALGGIGKFVKKGQKVVIKPNVGWDKPPKIPANTNPILIGEMVKQAFAAGAKDVVVFDTSCDLPKNCFQNSGIEEATVKAGGRIVLANKRDSAYSKYYRKIDLPEAKVLKTAEVHEEILDCDVWFNVPVLKVHSGAKMTVAMKNFMGIVLDPGAFHRMNLQQCIADICTLPKKPILNIIDGYRILKANGPQGRSEADGVIAKVLIASTDIVAADTQAVTIAEQVTKIGTDAVGHLKFGEELKLGTTDIKNKVNLITINLKNTKA